MNIHFSNVIFYSCRFPFCSLCFQKNCLGVHMKPHLKATLRHIQWQATVKKPSAALQFPSFEIGFFWFLWKEKSCQFSLFRGLNLLKGDKRSFFTSRIIFTKVVFRLLFCGRPILEALHVSFQPLFFSTDLFRPKANLETQSVETRLRKFN